MNPHGLLRMIAVPHYMSFVRMTTTLQMRTVQICWNKSLITSFIKVNHLLFLLEHMLSHSGERPFACNECDISFTRKRNLTRHLLKHEKEGINDQRQVLVSSTGRKFKGKQVRIASLLLCWSENELPVIWNRIPDASVPEYTLFVLQATRLLSLQPEILAKN